MARDLKRLTTNMPVELVTRIDEYADKMCINRSSAINVLCNIALDSRKAMDDMGELLKMAKIEQELKDKGE